MVKHTYTLVLNVVIVKYGMGSKVLSFAKQCGLRGGTIIHGYGTIKNSLLRFLELAESSKEIVLMLSNLESSSEFLKKAHLHFKFKKNNHGICFSLPVTKALGTQILSNTQIIKKDVNAVNYQSIFVIVDKGVAEDVVDAATEVGAKGATIINARGSGIHETSKLFSVDIEPEKELVMILVESSLTEKICENIKVKTEINQPGKGILFVQDVFSTYGLYST